MKRPDIEGILRRVDMEFKAFGELGPDSVSLGKLCVYAQALEADNRARNYDGRDWYYSIEDQQWQEVVSAYTPTSNLEQAWEFAREKDSRIEISNRLVVINGSFMEEHDGTPQDAARALTTCVLRANGVEVPSSAAERKTNDAK